MTERNPEWLHWYIQENSRRKTKRQIDYVQRQLDLQTQTAEQRARLQAELAALQTRFR